MNVLERPKQVYPVLVVMLVGLFALGSVGNGNKHNPTHGASYVIGAIGWFGFLITVVIVAAYSLALGLHTLRSRRVTEAVQR